MAKNQRPRLKSRLEGLEKINGPRVVHFQLNIQSSVESLAYLPQPCGSLAAALVHLSTCRLHHMYIDRRRYASLCGPENIVSGALLVDYALTANRNQISNGAISALRTSTTSL